MELVIFVILAAMAWFLISSHAKKKRREHLIKKYGDGEIVQRIMSKMFWQGQTQDQLLDSLGHPVDTDERVMKTKTKKTWKYNRVGRNRYGLRITLENGVVVGWDQK